MTFSAILVNYNDARHLEACLGALTVELAGKSAEIIVVDNASTDGSRTILSSRFPAVKTIANAANEGFARANNRGVRESRGEVLLFLNTDTVIQAGALSRLLETLASAPEIGACGPALIRGDGRFQVSFGRPVSFFGQLVQKSLLNPYYARALKHSKTRKSRRTAWLSAACLLFRRRAFEQAGGFDENFFIYFEDIDLCRRTVKAGWRLVFDPAARVFHEGGATTAARPEKSRWEYRRSQLLYYQKHASPFSRVLLRLSLRAAITAKAAFGGFRGLEGRDLRRKYRQLLKSEGGSR